MLQVFLLKRSIPISEGQLRLSICRMVDVTGIEPVTPCLQSVN